jgi:hypothetical protein
MSNPIQMDRARAFIQSRAQDFMSTMCEVKRPKDPTFDITTGFGEAGTRTNIYNGKCRVHEISGGPVVMVGEDEISQQNTQISFPWDMSPVPIKGDYIKITSSRVDTNLVGRVFKITDMAKSGELRATRRFSVVMIEEVVQHA